MLLTRNCYRIFAVSDTQSTAIIAGEWSSSVGVMDASHTAGFFCS